MEELIQMATTQLGLPEERVRSATGGLLQMMQGNSDEKDFSTLLQQVPGADKLVKAAPAADGGESGGMLGGLLNTAAAAVGGKAGSALGFAGIMSQSGLDAGQLGSLGAMLLPFLKGKVGGEVLGKLVSRIPELNSLLK